MPSFSPQKNNAEAASHYQADGNLSEYQHDSSAQYYDDGRDHSWDAGAYSESDSQGSDFQRSYSVPNLKPLAAPPSLYGSMDYMQRDPVEFELQKDMEGRRRAQKMLRQHYRQSMESMGHSFTYNPPWPPKEAPPVDDSQVKRPPKLNYRMPPFPLENPNPTSQRQKLVVEDSEPAGPKRKKAMAKLRTLSASSCGAPYTLGQIYTEVDARVHHKEARDTRALTGTLGPLELGPGTTRARRKFIFNGGKREAAWDPRRATAQRSDESPALRIEG